jgi:hypothetical protein
VPVDQSDVLARPLTFTVFRDAYAFECRRLTATPKEIAGGLRAHSANCKAGLDWIKLAAFGPQRSTEGCLRHDANVLEVNGTEGDYDQELISFDTACDLLQDADIAAVVYTSPSHTPEFPRWRVLPPFSRPLEPSQRYAMTARLNGVLGGVLSRESFTLSQSYYAGFVRANADNHRVKLVRGTAIDLLDNLDAGAIGPSASAGNGKAGSGGEAGHDAREDAELVRIIVTGDDGLHHALVALAARYVGRGTPPASVVTTLCGIMDAWGEERRDARWKERRGEIPRIVDSAVRKFRAESHTAFGACASVLMSLARRRSGLDVMQAAALAELARYGIVDAAARLLADQVADWCRRKMFPGASA